MNANACRHVVDTCSEPAVFLRRCLSFTLEMPFKDTIDTPDAAQGWCPERSLRFGASFLNPISEVLPFLR